MEANTPDTRAALTATDTLTVTTERSGGEITVTVAGEVDLNSLPPFQAAVDAAAESVARGDASRMVVDARAVPFMDSSGMGALHGAKKKIPPDAPRIALRLSAATPLPRNFSLGRFDKIFDIETF